MTATRLVLWRHGRTAHNAQARLQGVGLEFARVVQPALQLGAPVVGDGVLLAVPGPDRGHLDELVGGHPVELGVELALGGGPDEVQRGLEPLEEVPTGSGAIGEEAEQGVAEAHAVIIYHS